MHEAQTRKSKTMFQIVKPCDKVSVDDIPRRVHNLEKHLLPEN